MVGVCFPTGHFKHGASPLTALYNPGEHRLHELTPTDDENEPLAQGVQADFEFIPVRLLNVPTAQPSHMLAPAMLENVPLGHGMGFPVFE